MEIKKRTIYLLGAIIVIGVFIAIAATQTNANTNNKITGNTVNTKSGEYQSVKLSFKNYEYQLEPSNLKKDIPVRMEVDLDTVYGCMQDVVIPAFNVRKYVKEGDNIIEFTPDKSGTFNIACSMNMGRGTFSVSESDGTKSNFVEDTPIASAGSCGAGSGGCGCGG